MVTRSVHTLHISQIRVSNLTVTLQSFIFTNHDHFAAFPPDNRQRRIELYIAVTIVQQLATKTFKTSLLYQA